MDKPKYEKQGGDGYPCGHSPRTESDFERGFSVVQEFYTELFGTLIPGSLFVGGLALLFGGIWYAFTGDIPLVYLFAIGQWAPVVACCLLFLSFSYVAGAVAFRRDPNEPDKRGAVDVWIRKGAKKSNRDVFVFKTTDNNDRNSLLKSRHKVNWWKKIMDAFWPRRIESGADSPSQYLVENSQGIENRFPYPNLRTYLYSRGQKHLLKYVNWCGGFEAKNTGDKNCQCGARSKTFINVLKYRLEPMASPVMRMSMIKMETQIRMMSAIWYEARTLCFVNCLIHRICLIFSIGYVVCLLLSKSPQELARWLLNTIEPPQELVRWLLSAIELSQEQAWGRWLFFLVVLVAMRELCQYAIKTICPIIHDQRRREILMILEYAYFMENNDDEFKCILENDRDKETCVCLNCKHRAGCDSLSCKDAQVKDCTGYWCKYVDSSGSKKKQNQDESQSSVSRRIFGLRVKLLHALQDVQNQSVPWRAEYWEKIRDLLVEQVNLCSRQDSQDLTEETKSLLDKLKKADEWRRLNDNLMAEINRSIVPLVSDLEDEDAQTNLFDCLILTIEQSLAEFGNVEGALDEVADVRKVAKSLLGYGTIAEVMTHKDALGKVAAAEFWDNCTIELVEPLRNELRDLMKYIPKQQKNEDAGAGGAGGTPPGGQTQSPQETDPSLVGTDPARGDGK